MAKTKKTLNTVKTMAKTKNTKLCKNHGKNKSTLNTVNTKGTEKNTSLHPKVRSHVVALRRLITVAQAENRGAEIFFFLKKNKTHFLKGFLFVFKSNVWNMFFFSKVLLFFFLKCGFNAICWFLFCFRLMVVLFVWSLDVRLVDDCAAL